ncbi:Ribonucleotide reductase of class III (anaerobic), large subunit [Staphylococcus aureus]|uniref:Ribonucleotide reductase of class III (Anaerobic), large subunit n=1 Tax=Staphylococcus aureus TaxID=1280 RepID=A0A380DPL1_STAAU|nr:Ribonucleotide reductase of class III (anaerobic), large subunit [Staphylococcus aureus]
MLHNGFEIGNANVTSPKSIQTASAQLVQIIANVSSSQYGGCTVDRVTNYLVHMHDITKNNIEISQSNLSKNLKLIVMLINKSLKTSMSDESLEYEINTLYTSNGQTPL